MTSWIPDLRADAEIVCSGRERVSILLTTAEAGQLARLAACIDENTPVRLYGTTSAARRAGEPARRLGGEFLMAAHRAGGPGPVGGSAGTSLASLLAGKTMDEVERAVIHETIGQCGGSIPRAARMLGLAPSTVYRKLNAWAGRK